MVPTSACKRIETGASGVSKGLALVPGSRPKLLPSAISGDAYGDAGRGLRAGTPKCEAVAFVALGCREARADQGSKSGAHNKADLEGCHGPQQSEYDCPQLLATSIGDDDEDAGNDEREPCSVSQAVFQQLRR